MFGKVKWDKGIELFNEKRYWSAHEAWEKGWTAMKEGPEKNYIQSMIQTCGVMYHLGKGSAEPARSLATRARELMKDATPCHFLIHGVGALLRYTALAKEIPDLEKFYETQTLLLQAELYSPEAVEAWMSAEPGILLSNEIPEWKAQIDAITGGQGLVRDSNNPLPDESE